MNESHKDKWDIFDIVFTVLHLSSSIKMQLFLYIYSVLNEGNGETDTFTLNVCK